MTSSLFSSDQKVAIVTGSSSGIGFETSLTLARSGFLTYATMRNLGKGATIKSVAAKEGLRFMVSLVCYRCRRSIRIYQFYFATMEHYLLRVMGKNIFQTMIIPCLSPSIENSHANVTTLPKGLKNTAFNQTKMAFLTGN